MQKYFFTFLCSIIFLTLLSYSKLYAESLPLEIDADSSDCGTDLENCTLSGNVLIRQGDAVIRADKLFSLSENDWELNGNIVIEDTGMTIDAQQANIALFERQLRSFSLTGEPVSFHYLVGDSKRANGKANKISFDLNTRMISLDGSAQLIEAGNELNGDHIEYDIDAERLKANNQGQANDPNGGQSGGRVHLIFEPPQKTSTDPEEKTDSTSEAE